jgi:hypothetical protein
MRRPAARALALAIAALCAVACSRRSGYVGYGLVQSAIAAPVPASEMEASSLAQAPPPAPDPPAPSGPTGPLGRKPVPVEIDGQTAPAGFARVAPPSADHPRGTLAVFRTVFVPEPPFLGTNGENGGEDVELAEIDLATAAPLRRGLLGHGIRDRAIAEGASGPVLFVQSRTELTLFWVNAAFSIVARRSVPALGSNNVELCAFTAVGDRAVLADCGAEKAARTRLWIFDARSEPLQRSCPGRNVNDLITITPWKDRAVVTGLATSSGPVSCALRADGRGEVVTGSYSFNIRLLAGGGALYGARYGDHDYRVVGDDLRLKGPTVPDPRPPEVVAAEALRGYASRLRARLIAGTIVLEPLYCCGETGPGLYLFDPHADE